MGLICVLTVDISRGWAQVIILPLLSPFKNAVHRLAFRKKSKLTIGGLGEHSVELNGTRLAFRGTLLFHLKKTSQTASADIFSMTVHSLVPNWYPGDPHAAQKGWMFSSILKPPKKIPLGGEILHLFSSARAEWLVFSVIDYRPYHLPPPFKAGHTAWWGCHSTR